MKRGLLLLVVVHFSLAILCCYRELATAATRTDEDIGTIAFEVQSQAPALTPLPPPMVTPSRQERQLAKTNVNRKAYQISVIIPACNRLNSLKDAVDSVLNQTYPALEIIVALDAEGTSCVQNIHNSWETETTRKRVKIFRVPPCEEGQVCGQAGRVRHQAIIQATSDDATHYAFLDDDDLWMPHKLERQVELMKAGNYRFVSSDAYFPKKKGKRCARKKHNSKNNPVWIPYNLNDTQQFGIWNTKKWKRYILRKLGLGPKDDFPSRVDLPTLMKHNFFIASATMMDKTVYLGFDETKRNWDAKDTEDYDLWKRTLNITDGLFIAKPLVVYDNHRYWCDVPSLSSLASTTELLFP